MSQIQQGMTALERRTAISMASIYAIRMLGLFMILPVFSLYARHLEGVTPTLIGLAIGMYGFTQALLQIPFGILSDRFGRKPVIVVGLLIFAAGSVVAALSDSIWGVIAGRALQGSGAVAAAVMALAADLTREEHRTKVMAVIGTSIGMSFALSMVLGPVLNHWIGVPGIFWLTAGLALLGIAILYYGVPQPDHVRMHHDAEADPRQLKGVIKDTELRRLDAGIFVLHMLLTANFVVLPVLIRDDVGLPSSWHWVVYLPVFLAAVAIMVPFIIVAEKRRRMKEVFVGAVVVLMLAEFVLAIFFKSLAGIVVGLLLFFTAFNVLEATLPSLVAKVAPPDKKGTAMGIYSTSQFLGAFCGGLAGGGLSELAGAMGVFVFCALSALLWIVIAVTMASPRYFSSYMVNVGKIDEVQAKVMEAKLLQVRGVVEAAVLPEDGVAYLKVDSRSLDLDALGEFSVN